MKHLSPERLAEIVVSRRKALKLSQAALAEKVNMNRSVLSRLEMKDYSPSVDQLLALGDVLGFEPGDVIAEDAAAPVAVGRKKRMPLLIQSRGLRSWR